MEIISGEKFQRLADISIISPQTKKFQKNLRDIKLLIIPEFWVIIKPRLFYYIQQIKKSHILFRMPFIIKRILRFLNLNIIQRFKSEKFVKVIIEDLVRIPTIIQKAKIIFVYNHLLDFFFAYIYPFLQQRFILISHNSDHSISNKYNKYLKDNKIVKWYGQNCGISHPKLIPIPIGIANTQWDHGDEKTFQKIMGKIKSKKKEEKAYANFKITTNRKHRQKVYKIVKNNKFVVKKKIKSYYKYLEELDEFKYSIVPRGNGQDCHRLWESLYLDTIPVIDDKKLFENFTTGSWEGTPIIFIKNWKKFSEELIIKEEKNLVIKNKWRKNLNFKYWKNLIENDLKKL